MSRLRRVGPLLMAVAVLAAACGGDDDAEVDEAVGDDTGEDAESGDGAATGDGGSGGEDTGVVIEVDGVTYMVDTELGGSCETQGDPEQGSDLYVAGYDVETGRRVEMSFDRQSAEFSPSGEEEFYGGLFIALDEGGDWQVASLEPWPWLGSDGPGVTGTVTMEDFDGQSVEVTFDVTCP